MFAIKTNDLDSCNSYEGAKKLWARQGCNNRRADRDNDARNLRSRADHLQVVRDGDTYNFNLYRTTVVRWHNPTRVTINVTYDSVSTNKFAGHFSPFSVVNMRKGTYLVQYGRADSKPWFAGKNQLTFDLVDGLWVPAHPDCAQRVVSVLDTEGRAEVRKRFKSMLDWATAMESIGYSFRDNRREVVAFSQLAKLVPDCLGENAEEVWSLYAHNCSYHCRAGTIRDSVLRHLYSVHRSECVREVVVPAGELPPSTVI